VKPLTDDERWVLTHQYRQALHAMADGKYGVDQIRDSWNCGGGGGWSHQVHKNRIDVERHEWGPDPEHTGPCPPGCQLYQCNVDAYRWDHTPDGQHIGRWLRGPLIRAASITLPQLLAWVEQLPVPIRERAAALYRHPGGRWDPDAARALVATALDDTFVAPLRDALNGPLPTRYPGQLVGQEALF
jgi:hypothetical protein